MSTVILEIVRVGSVPRSATTRGAPRACTCAALQTRADARLAQRSPCARTGIHAHAETHARTHVYARARHSSYATRPTAKRAPVHVVLNNSCHGERYARARASARQHPRHLISMGPTDRPTAPPGKREHKGNARARWTPRARDFLTSPAREKGAARSVLHFSAFHDALCRERVVVRR